MEREKTAFLVMLMKVYQIELALRCERLEKIVEDDDFYARLSDVATLLDEIQYRLTVLSNKCYRIEEALVALKESKNTHESV